ncbi:MULTISPECIES: threonine/serine exporter family protein [Pontibacillus]|uniref:Threonine/serine exporter family protein n=1 Tax=Pontibacillus chungwhensis TaxID=265426 RepID=A0ABY8UYI2_9BACI|nr:MULTISPECIES: threonine/serine exporter family protein [Pontibacillus]MCD5325693.1 threonine/serine exporter family protein [Pontibacillus sp. HN14]WIF98067.1 threonine/serine exporter family protein [Pontibacillus chungwhensis]
MIAEQFFTSFIASAAFGVIFQAPRNTLLKCGLVGSIGWVIYILFVESNIDAVTGTFVASFVIAMIGQFFARLYKTPVIVFSVAGIIPLVPGGLAYDAMRNFVQNDYGQALPIAAKVFMISGAIAIGLVLSEVMNQVFKKMRKRELWR